MANAKQFLRFIANHARTRSLVSTLAFVIVATVLVMSNQQQALAQGYDAGYGEVKHPFEKFRFPQTNAGLFGTKVPGSQTNAANTLFDMNQNLRNLPVYNTDYEDQARVLPYELRTSQMLGLGIDGPSPMNYLRNSKLPSYTQRALNQYGGYRTRMTNNPADINVIMQRRYGIVTANTPTAGLMRLGMQTNQIRASGRPLSSIPLQGKPSDTSSTSTESVNNDPEGTTTEVRVDPVAQATQDVAAVADRMRLQFEQRLSFAERGAWDHLARGEYTQAAAKFRSCTTLAPERADLRIAESLCHVAAGNMRTAIVIMNMVPDDNLFISFDFSSRFPSVQTAAQIRLTARSWAGQLSTDADLAALEIFTAWYLGSREDARFAASSLNRRFTTSTKYQNWNTLLSVAYAKIKDQ